MSSGTPQGLHSSLSQTNPKMEPKGRKKIQFSVAVPPDQLDPRAVEMIRRRRPTPATLFRVSEPQSPDEDPTIYQKLSGDTQPLTTKRPNPYPYIPPSIKAVQRLVQSHMQSLGSLGDSDDEDGDDDDEDEESTEDTVMEEPNIKATSTESEDCLDCGAECGAGDEDLACSNLETLLNHTLLEDRAGNMETYNTQTDTLCEKQPASLEHP
ncbi:protein phosphatase 1 regulatory subunit 1B [Pseudophryne corroboree]|uniref:protein phosphatase 1 regulatory subunit 1B n=1 Tax=Pseudophryne corroboree TaxID=495146 RepID=UPI003081308C